MCSNQIFAGENGLSVDGIAPYATLEKQQQIIQMISTPIFTVLHSLPIRQLFHQNDPKASEVS